MGSSRERRKGIIFEDSPSRRAHQERGTFRSALHPPHPLPVEVLPFPGLALEFLRLWLELAGARMLRANPGLDPSPLPPPGNDGDGVRGSLDKVPLWSPLLFLFSWFGAK